MILTYRDIKNSPSGWKDLKMEDFELALSKLIDDYRSKIDKAKAVEALEAQAQLVIDDESWTDPEQGEATEDSDEEEE
jgi:hypothetical protein